MKNQENKVDKIFLSSSNDVRDHCIENINEKNDYESDNVIINDDVININEGDEESNEENDIRRWWKRRQQSC